MPGTRASGSGPAVGELGMTGGIAADGKGAVSTTLPGALPGLKTRLSAAGPVLGIIRTSGAPPPCSCT